MAKNKQQSRSTDLLVISLIAVVLATNAFWIAMFLSQRSINQDNATNDFNQQIQISNLKLCIEKELKDCTYLPLAQE
jgi:hypothetical protein